MTDEIATCPACHTQVLPDAVFCSRCGTKLKDPMTFGRELTAYFIGLFLPPFGILTGIKYLGSRDGKTRRVGATAILLTFVSVIVTVILTVQVLRQLNAQIGSQVELYQELQ